MAGKATTKPVRTSSSRRPPLSVLTLLSAWGRILRGDLPLLSIEITRDCPLHCPGCYAYGPEHLGGGLTLRQLRDRRGEDLIRGILDLVERHRPLHVSFVGGEPLLRHRELDRILPVLSRRGIFSLVVTSAVIPFPERWNQIPRVTVAVSVDGLPAEHDARRKPATYQRILQNLQGRRADISWVVTEQQASQPGYLDRYLAFWSARPEVGRIWMSLYTPQLGERSREVLTQASRQRILEELPALKKKYPALILPLGGDQAFARPPGRPERCTFARLSAAYSADLRTRLQPCFFGGNPDCSQCGCAVSAGLHWLHSRRLWLGLRVGDIMDPTLALAGVFSRPALQRLPRFRDRSPSLS